MKNWSPLEENRSESEFCGGKAGRSNADLPKKAQEESSSSCKEEEVKRLKKDDGHDDQGPSHHEGEQKGEGVSAEAEATKTAETSKEPILHTE